jgi:hypothetical protein
MVTGRQSMQAEVVVVVVVVNHKHGQGDAILLDPGNH